MLTVYSPCSLPKETTLTKSNFLKWTFVIRMDFLSLSYLIGEIIPVMVYQKAAFFPLSNKNYNPLLTKKKKKKNLYSLS